MYWTTTTSRRQGHHREVLSEGSRRQTCEPRNTKAIGGRVPGASQHHMTKPSGSGDTVNGTVAQGKFTLLSGEICPAGGRRRHGSRTEAHPERAGSATEPYRGAGSAARGNVCRDRAEVSRGHSSSGAGEAVEALQCRKAESTDRPSRNASERRPERGEQEGAQPAQSLQPRAGNWPNGQSKLWRQVETSPGQRNLCPLFKPHTNRPVRTRMPGGVGAGGTKTPRLPA